MTDLEKLAQELEARAEPWEQSALGIANMRDQKDSSVGYALGQAGAYRDAARMVREAKTVATERDWENTSALEPLRVMPPMRSYRMTVRIVGVTKGQPLAIGPDDLGW